MNKIQAAKAYGVSSTLPNKEQSILRHMAWLYERKQYKKAVKQADLILKKFPEHGETLCMKGLILSFMGDERKHEAYELAKRGLRFDIKNYICWHVLGLLYRHDKDYDEAQKCFSQALRLNQSNLTIMRDLSNLQIHQRNLEGFRETRRKILQLRSQYISEWTSFALANHLCGHLDVAHDIILEVEQQFDDARDLNKFEKSEMLLYNASLLEESGRLNDCIEFLKAREEKIVDRVSALEMMGRVALYLGRMDDAYCAFERLFETNRDCEMYFLGMLACCKDTVIRNMCEVPRLDFRNDGRSNVVSATEDELKNEGHDKCIVFLPNAFKFTGEGRGNWLVDKQTTRFLSDIRISEEMLALKGWKGTLNDYKSSLFVIRRIPTLQEQDRLLQFFHEVEQTYGQSVVTDSLILLFLSGEKFVRYLDAYLRQLLRKGVVALFSVLKRVYTPERCHYITALLEFYMKNFESTPSHFGSINTYIKTYIVSPERYDNENSDSNKENCTLTNATTNESGSAACVEKREYSEKNKGEQHDNIRTANGDYESNEESSDNSKNMGDQQYENDDESEVPTTYLYLSVVLSQHYDFIGETDKALRVIDKAIKHTPTFSDLYVTKGRIYKHAGAYRNACDFYEKARNLDLADRYLNTKACSRFMKLGRSNEAIETGKLFSKQSGEDDVSSYNSIQFFWFETRLGLSYFLERKYGRSLQQFHFIIKHFFDIKEDQFDFHSYCLRKLAYRSYVDFLRMQDQLLTHEYFRNAAMHAINMYIDIHLKKIKIDVSTESTKNEKLKKEKRKNKNTSLSTSKETNDYQINNDNKNNNNASNSKVKVSPLFGELTPHNLLTQKPLEAAAKLVSLLLEHAYLDKNTHVLAYKFFAVQGSIQAMILAIARLGRLVNNHIYDYQLFPLIYHFSTTQSIENIDEQDKDVIFKSLSVLLNKKIENDSNLRECSSEMIARVQTRIKNNPHDIRFKESVLEALIMTELPLKDYLDFFHIEESMIIPNEFELKSSSEYPTITQCVSFFRLLSSVDALSPLRNRFKEICNKRFPYADDFIMETQ